MPPTIAKTQQAFELLAALIQKSSIKAELDLDLQQCEGMIKSPVLHASENMSAIDVLRILANQKLASVPIMSEDMEWVATATASDLKVCDITRNFRNLTKIFKISLIPDISAKCANFNT
jgi:predicted transcriptional regulator